MPKKVFQRQKEKLKWLILHCHCLFLFLFLFFPFLSFTFYVEAFSFFANTCLIAGNTKPRNHRALRLVSRMHILYLWSWKDLPAGRRRRRWRCVPDGRGRRHSWGGNRRNRGHLRERQARTLSPLEATVRASFGAVGPEYHVEAPPTLLHVRLRGLRGGAARRRAWRGAAGERNWRGREIAAAHGGGVSRGAVRGAADAETRSYWPEDEGRSRSARSGDVSI